MSRRAASAPSSLRWLLADRCLRLVATVPIALLVARSLGPDDFGRLGVALGLSGIGIVMAQLGLDRVLRRDLSERPEEAGQLVGTAALLALGGALAAVAAIGAYAQLAIDDPAARRVVSILAWGAVPQVLSPAEAWFQSVEHPRRAVLARTLVTFAAAVARVVACVLDWSVAAFAYIALLEWTAMAAAIALLFLSHARAPAVLRFVPGVARRWGREVWPLFLMLGLGAAVERFDLLILQHLSPGPETGYFAAAQRISELWWSLSVTTAVAVLPWLARARAGGRGGFLRAMQRYFDASLAVTIPVAVAATLAAPVLLPTLLGREYAPAVPVAIALCWAAPAVYAEVARSQYLLLERKVHVDVGFNLAHAAVGAGLCVWAVPRWGASGAAVARLAGFSVVAWILPWCLPATREVARLQWRAFLFPRRHAELVPLLAALLRRSAGGQPAASIASIVSTYRRTIDACVNWATTRRRAAVPSARARLSSRSKA